MQVKKMIFVEGPNGAGKSTLAKILSEKYCTIVHHATKPKTIRESIEMAHTQETTIRSNGFPIVYDRSHAISCLVYQDKKLTNEWYEELIEQANYLAENAILIYCTGEGPRDVDKPHYDEQLIKETTEDQENIKARYTKLMATLPHVKFDFNNDEISSLQLK